MTGSPQTSAIARITVFFCTCQGSYKRDGSQRAGLYVVLVQAPPRREKAPLLRRSGTAAPGLQCEQSLNSAARRCFRRALIHQNLLLGNTVQCRPNWFCTASGNLQFAISTSIFRSVIKMSCFLPSRNSSPEKAAQPDFSGLPLTPGADLVVMLPAASDNNQYFPTVHSIKHSFYPLTPKLEEQNFLRKLRNSMSPSFPEKRSMGYTVPYIWKCLLPVK